MSIFTLMIAFIVAGNSAEKKRADSGRLGIRRRRKNDYRCNCWDEWVPHASRRSWKHFWLQRIWPCHFGWNILWDTGRYFLQNLTLIYFRLLLLLYTHCAIYWEGSNYGPNIRNWLNTRTKANLGQCFIAVDPGCFAPGFESRLSDLMSHFRHMEPVC